MLNEFGINFIRDIVASSHDGASIMQSYEKKTGVISQRCLIHAIHLGVTKVLYKKNSSNMFELYETSDNLIDDPYEDEDDYHTSENEDDYHTSENEDESNEIDDSDNSESESEDEMNELFYNIPKNVELKETIEEKLNNTRKLIKHFKKSVVKNGVLQQIVQEKFNKKYKLILDVKIRWNSIIKMIKRVILIKSCIESALNKLNEKELFYTIDFDFLDELVKILDPLEEAITIMSKNNCDLLIAEGSIKFIFQRLRENKTSLSKEIFYSLKNQITKRRNKELISLIKFLQTISFDFIDQNDEIFIYSSKKEIITFAQKVYERLFPDEDENILTTTIETIEDDLFQLENENLQKNLKDFIEEEKKTTKKIKNETIKNDINISITNGELTFKLRKLFNALLTIQPSSISSERSFSVAKRFVSANRNRLSDELINCFVYLNFYFKKKENKQN